MTVARTNSQILFKGKNLIGLTSKEIEELLGKNDKKDYIEDDYFSMNYYDDESLYIGFVFEDYKAVVVGAGIFIEE